MCTSSTSAPTAPSAGSTARSPKWSDCWCPPSSAKATGGHRRTGRPHDSRVDHRRRHADHCRGRHPVPLARRAEHIGSPGGAGHPCRGDDVRDRHLGGLQPRHHRDIRPDRSGVDQLRRLGQRRAIPGARYRQAPRRKAIAMSALDIVTAVLVLGGSTLALTAAIGVVRFPDTLTRMHAATKPQVLGLLLVLAGAAIRLRGNADVGMIILTGLFTLITAPVVANPVGQLAYREQNIRDDLLTRDEMLEFAEEREPGTNGQD